MECTEKYSNAFHDLFLYKGSYCYDGKQSQILILEPASALFVTISVSDNFRHLRQNHKENFHFEERLFEAKFKKSGKKEFDS